MFRPDDATICNNNDAIDIVDFYDIMIHYVNGSTGTEEDIKKYHAYDTHIQLMLKMNMMYKFFSSFTDRIDYVVFWNNVDKISTCISYKDYVDILMKMNNRAAINDLISSIYQTLTIDELYVQLATNKDRRENDIPQKYVFLANTFGIETFSERSYMSRTEYDQWYKKYIYDGNGNYDFAASPSTVPKTAFDNVIKHTLKFNRDTYSLFDGDTVYQQICSNIGGKFRFTYDMFHPNAVYTRYQELYVYIVENYLVPYNDLDCRLQTHVLRIKEAIIDTYGKDEYFQFDES